MAAIEIDSVSKRFGRVRAVSDLSFEVEAVGRYEPDEVGMDDVRFFAFMPALGLMVAWIGVFFAAGAALLRARDIE